MEGEVIQDKERLFCERWERTKAAIRGVNCTKFLQGGVTVGHGLSEPATCHWNEKRFRRYE